MNLHKLENRDSGESGFHYTVDCTRGLSFKIDARTGIMGSDLNAFFPNNPEVGDHKYKGIPRLNLKSL